MHDSEGEYNPKAQKGGVYSAGSSFQSDNQKNRLNSTTVTNKDNPRTANSSFVGERTPPGRQTP